MTRWRPELCVVVALAVASCGGGGGGAGGPAPEPGVQTPAPTIVSRPTPAPEPTSGAGSFVDVTTSSGIAYAIGYRSLFPIGKTPRRVADFATGGVAAGDYDADGDIDLFITRGDIGPNLLYRNNGEGVFDEVAAAAGLAYTATASENYRHSGPTFADMDGDGDLDLFIGGLYRDPSLIFVNNGDGTFSDATAGSGIDALSAAYTISAAFGDYDLDGDVDLFLAHWGTDRDPLNPGDTEHLWRNDSGPGKIVFTSVSESANISASILFRPGASADPYRDDWTFTPTFARIDSDLYPDILSVADFRFTHFFINNRDGTFSNRTNPSVITDGNGMGSAVGDYDNDGDLDWFVTAIYEGNTPHSGNRFYENEDGEFADRTGELGVRDGGWGWGACFLDFDNDGDLDIYHTNGWTLDGEYEDDPSRMFAGSGGGAFVENAASLGLADTEEGRGVVCADFDGDGDVDIFQLHRRWPVAATLWRNDNHGNNYLKIKLIGRAPNTEAAGARIHVTVGNTTQMREIMIGSNFVSQNPTIQVFGLGKATQADELRIEWPDGQELIDSAVPAGGTLTYSQQEQ